MAARRYGRWRTNEDDGSLAIRLDEYAVIRGVVILYGAVSDYVGFDYSGDGKKRNLTQTFEAVNR